MSEEQKVSRSRDLSPHIGSVSSGQSRLSIEVLTAGQPEDVWERSGYWRANACVIAMQREVLLEALKGAIGALEFSRDYHNDLGNEDQAFAQDRLDAATAAIAAAEGRQ